MKRLFITGFVTTIALTGFAQSKLDLQSRMSLFEQRIQSSAQSSSSKQSKSIAPLTYTTAFVEVNSDSARAELEANGATILRQYGDIAIVSLPWDKVEPVSALKGVKRMQLSRKVKSKMKDVRQVTGIDKIHSGLELPASYTGKGVVTGLVDNGFDANHINFRDENGKTRVKYMSRYVQSEASKDGYVCYNYYPAEDLDLEADMTFAVEDFTSDQTTNYHGTHTCGIMCGGYRGETTYSVQVAANGDSKNVTGPNPYYGAAYDSEIICSCGDLVDSYIAMGVEDIYNYSLYSNGFNALGKPLAPKPCVVNLSLGSNLGSHDPNDLFNRVLDIFAEDIIICVASGNEADYPIALNKTLTAEDNKLQTFMAPKIEGVYNDGSHDYYNLRKGSILVYASDDREFQVQMVVYNKKRGSIVKRYGLEHSTEGSMVAYCTGGDFSISGATEDASLAQRFEGYIGMATVVDPNVNRYCASISYLTSDNQEQNADGNYILGLIVIGQEGQRIDVYGDDGYCYFDSFGQEAKGYVSGSRNGTINDMACGYGTICVGAYNIKNHWASMDGYSYGYDGFPEGQTSSFSSYGTLGDGRNLPHVCAPGTTVISSINTYCVENPLMGFSNVALQASYKEPTGRVDYWMQERGTSMATPVVAGAIALWLEADPDLTVDEIRDIIQKTAVVDDDVRAGDSVQWGAGKFDAYAGLKEVLNRKGSGIQGLHADKGSEPVINQVGERQFKVFCAGEHQMEVRLFSAAGHLLEQISVQGDEAFVDASNWQSGVYVLQVNGKNARRILVK